jgi:hypothetical protein
MDPPATLFNQAKRTRPISAERPTLVIWSSKGIKDTEGLRTQFAHAIDIAPPTILEVVGIRSRKP